MCAHLCVDRERANSVVEVGCRNFFLRLGMEPVSPGMTDPGVPQRTGSTDGARRSGFPRSSSSGGFREMHAKASLPHGSPDPASPCATPARLREGPQEPARTSAFGGDKQEPQIGFGGGQSLARTQLRRGRARTCRSGFSAGVNLRLGKDPATAAALERLNSGAQVNSLSGQTSFERCKDQARE